MDASTFRIVNRFADRAGWLHPPVVAFAKYGIVAFAPVLLVGWWLGWQRREMTTLAAVVCAVVAAFVASGAAQLIGQVVVAGGLWFVDRRLARSPLSPLIASDGGDPERA